MYQPNALSDNNHPLLALLSKKHIGFAVPTTAFIHIEEKQHESYLGVMIDNKLSLNQHIDDMSKKATNLLNYVVVASTCVLKKLKTRHIIWLFVLI